MVLILKSVCILDWDMTLGVVVLTTYLIKFQQKLGLG